MAMCIYNNCSSVQKPFSSLAFFALPKDSRRQLWIENSGNAELASLSESARRVVCEKHFSPSCLRKQFHRTILSRDAVPEKWCLELIEIHDILPDDVQTQDNFITIDEQSDDEGVQKGIEDWQNEYQNSSVDPTESDVVEFEIDDSDTSLQDDVAIVDIVDNADQDEQINGEKINVLESILPDNQLSNPYPPFLDEIEIETINPEKRKIADVDDISVQKIPKCSDKHLEQQPCKSEQTLQTEKSKSIAYDVSVSSSTTKTDESSSGSLHAANEEDKYFSLALVGILQRISPQKRAFAKLNILRYLTELEYGLEASIK